MTSRRRLLNRCRSESFTFTVDGLKFTATIGRFEDGGIGELFLNNHKAGNQSDTNARDAMTAARFITALEIFRERCEARALLFAAGELDLHTAVDALEDNAECSGLVRDIGQDAVQAIMANAFRPYRKREP